MTLLKPHHFVPSEIRRFILENNAIEGILRPISRQENEAWRNFLLHPSPGVVEVERLARHYHAEAEIDPAKRTALATFMQHLSQKDPHETHLVFMHWKPIVTAKPDGRVGRGIWAWQMLRRDGKLPLAFLQPFYAQTLEAS